jgi:hypothetical protein
MSEEVTTQPEIKPKKMPNYFPVSLKADMLARVDAVCLSMGMKRSRAKYVRAAVEKQLAVDEAPRGNVSDDPEPAVQEPGV